MKDALALPLAFVGFPDWRVVRWTQEHPVEARVDILLLASGLLVVVLVWAIVSLEVERYKRRQKRK